MSKVAIIGDLFMAPQVFEQALDQACGDSVKVHSHTLPWPDEPMVHGYGIADLSRLREFMGTAEDTIARIGDAEILVTQLAPLSESMMERLPCLRLVAVSRGGPVNIDLAAARQRGLPVVNTPGRNASAVAEFTIGLILSHTRNIIRGHEALRRGRWRGDLYRADRTGRELSEMTVGVIGYGEIGSRVVRLLKVFGCRILVADPHVALAEEDEADGVRQVVLGELLEHSDIVTLHARVTSETEGFIDHDVFRAMKCGAFFVNTARGPLVDYDALDHALAGGRLGGAALETFAAEPVPSDSPLLGRANVVLTPHIAGASIRTVRVAAAGVAEEVRRHLSGEPPLNPC